VKKGDTLFAIAQRFDTTVVAIIKLNAITDPALIRVGQVLKIP
jgi:LysM repeat protein